jgi:succinyl-CoA synthetase beta subunit
VVVKAQVKTGGRGKWRRPAAEGPDEAQARAQEILGMDIKGHRVNAVLVERPATSPGVLPVLPGGPGRAHVHLDLLGAGRRGDRRGGAHQSRRGRPGDGGPALRRGQGEGRRDRVGGRAPAEAAGAAAAAERLWAVFADEDATLVEVNR